MASAGKLLIATHRLNAQSVKAKIFIKYGKLERMIDNLKKYDCHGNLVKARNNIDAVYISKIQHQTTQPLVMNF